MFEYLQLILLLLQWRALVCTPSPTLEDNMLPTDEEVISDLINSYRRGQPEQEIALNLPTDEEAFNEIKPILQAGNPIYYINGGGRFYSSSFPEIDARGFHESVFDDLDDFYPISQRGKKYDPSALAVSARGFYGDVFTDGFGNFHPVKRYFKNRDRNSRQKRSYRQASPAGDRRPPAAPPAVVVAADVGPRQLPPPERTCRRNDAGCGGRDERSRAFADEQPRFGRPPLGRTANASAAVGAAAPNRTAASARRKRAARPFDWGPVSARYSDDEMRAVGRPKRVPQTADSGLRGDVFGAGFGRFDTLKRDPSSEWLHGDAFHKNFGKFETLKKRSRDDAAASAAAISGDSYAAKRRPQPNGVNADAFYSNFGHFETLKRSSPAGSDDEDEPRTAPAAFAYGRPHPKRVPHAALLSGDAFHANFGAFDTMKRTLGGDAFHSQFGRFETMKRAPAPAPAQAEAARRYGPGPGAVAWGVRAANGGDGGSQLTRFVRNLLLAAKLDRLIAGWSRFRDDNVPRVDLRRTNTSSSSTRSK